jgi:hypothetical protein
MRWDAVQLGAKAKGCLVYAIDQAQTAVLTQPGPWGSAFDGYCIGLAADWISLAYHGKDFPTDGHQVCNNPPWQATQAQNLSDASKRGDWTEFWKAAIEPFQCRLSHFRAVRDHKPSAAFLCAVVFQAYGCYGVTLRGGSGAHAVAIRHGRDGRFHLFDANYFHLAVKGTDKFQDLISWWLQQTGYDKKYDTRTGIVGIQPPITHTH